MTTALGDPDHDTTIRLLADAAQRDRSSVVSPLITSKAVHEMGTLASSVHVDPAVLGYISRIATETRTSPEVRLGVSVRGALAYVRAAKTWAASRGRNYVTPDDIKHLAHPVLDHRLLLDPEAEFAGASVPGVIDRIIGDVQPPAESAA